MVGLYIFLFYFRQNEIGAVQKLIPTPVPYSNFQYVTIVLKIIVSFIALVLQFDEIVTAASFIKIK